MPRQARVVAVGVPHHITQRGNNRQDVFLLDEDRRFYLDSLREQCRLERIRLLGYCLMTNHIHLVAVPERADSLARGIGGAHLRYARRFNQRYRRSGHLWQNRFFSCPLGPDRLTQALAYVDLNPVRAGLAGRAAEYPWSSAAAHIEGRNEGGLLQMRNFTEIASGEEWAQRLASQEGAADAPVLREATYAGRPLGDEAFVRDLTERLGRELRRKPMGRPPKARSSAAGGGIG